MKNNKHTSPRFGCGEMTNVEGTNGGKMACGSKLTYLNGLTEQYYCAKCDSLIAAAPDMLEALEMVFDLVHRGRVVMENNGQLLKVKQAIAKAKED